MKIIEVQALPNGAHRNQSGEFSTIPDGWAVIPEDMPIPDTFPFVNIEAEEIIHYKDVYTSQEVTKTREVVTVNDDGEEVTTTEEYTEQEMVTVQEPYTVLTVTSMTEGVMPVPEPETEPTPTIEERVTTLEESNAEMTEALELILSGVTE